MIYVGEPDVVHEIRPDGAGLVFGRDPDVCHVVVWSALNDPTLSRRAGAIWLMDGQLWLRNLSTSHDLLVQVPGQPPEPYLPPRADGQDPGPARSLPTQTCLVLGPAGCELVVQPPAGAAALGDIHLDSDMEHTVQLPDVPAHLRDVAVALCTPLLAGGRLPATYAQICDQLGMDSHKRVRTLVAELCALYSDASPEVAERVRARQVREERVVSALASHDAWRAPGGVWRFDRREDPEEERRRRALALPEYYEVAHLLVRRGLVGRDALTDRSRHRRPGGRRG